MMAAVSAARVRDAEATRGAVLDAAEQAFAARGYAGATIQEISDDSGVNKPVIYYHFGSKDGLYAAVKQRLVERYVRLHLRTAQAIEPPADLSEEIRRIVRSLCESEAMLRILNWASLEGRERGRPGEELIDVLRRRIELAQERRIIRGDIDPRNLGAMLVGLVFSSLESWSCLAGSCKGGLDERAYLHQAIALIERGVTPRD